MNQRSLRNRTQTAFHQARELLENHYREYQLFHNRCDCGADCDHDGIEDYDATLVHKKQEAYIASITIDEMFDENGCLNDNYSKILIMEFLRYCMIYAEKHSPFLYDMFASLLVEIRESYDASDDDDDKNFENVVVSFPVVH